jgi:hypothetical protein
VLPTDYIKSLEISFIAGVGVMWAKFTTLEGKTLEKG